MHWKSSRPAARGGAHRATGSEFLGRFSSSESSSVDLEKPAEALQRGAILYIGPDETSVDLERLRTFLQGTFPFDDSYRHDRLIVPTVICAHWFEFTGRQCGLNHRYPATFLRELITTCFGLDYTDIPMDAVLGGLAHRGFRVERIKPKSAVLFNWAATIRSMTHPPAGGSLIRITELGKRGAIPPIRISE
jgi:hypothetical protein